jgi:hypothetical protein
MSLLSHACYISCQAESSFTGLPQWNAGWNRLLYKAVWHVHFSIILSVKGPNPNRSLYAHLWLSAHLGGPSISCHTVAVPIKLMTLMQLLKVPQYNWQRSVSKATYYFASRRLIFCVYFSIFRLESIWCTNFWTLIPYVDMHRHQRTTTQQRNFLIELLSRSSLMQRTHCQKYDFGNPYDCVFIVRVKGSPRAHNEGLLQKEI